jgi:hypothetical protein
VVRTPLRFLGLLAMTLALATACDDSPFLSPSDSPGNAGSSSSSGPGAAGAAAAQTTLASLTIATQHAMTGYSRDRFPHWRKVDEYCDVRDAVLKRDGTGVTASKTCKITKGTWASQYDNKTYKNPDLIDIDHMVPLADAWRSGADTWTDAQRSDFANDLVRPQLMAVSRSSNRAKGDQDPSQWKPPNRGYWCEYARRWITVKAYWTLTVTDKEKSALREMLGTCRAQSSGPPTSSPSPAGS